jgi:predicted O-methyltransferase YrrM
VEIGTASGGALSAFCQIASKDALLVSIDLPGGEFGGAYHEGAISGRSDLARKGQSLRFLRCDSHEQSTRQALLDILAGREVDLLFIDGDHTYDGVKADFEMYSALVSPAGIVAFHDVLKHPQLPTCEVDRFWNEIKADFVHHEFLVPDDDRGWGPWGGIGVLEMSRNLRPGGRR